MLRFQISNSQGKYEKIGWDFIVFARLCVFPKRGMFQNKSSLFYTCFAGFCMKYQLFWHGLERNVKCRLQNWLWLT